MPICIPHRLPAKKVLQHERVHVMDEMRAVKQDIRPLQIAILNLMPEKIKTETQLARLLGNTSLQVELTLLTTKTYRSKNTSEEHLIDFYKTWDDVKDRNFDGLIVTGAPLGQMKYEDVQYWEELTQIFDWSQTHCFRNFFICWGAMAALYHFYGVEKQVAAKKLSGVFDFVRTPHHPRIFRGINDEFVMPTSRFAYVTAEDIAQHKELCILANSEDVGVGFVEEEGDKNMFMLTHPEYDHYTLKDEYERDLAAGLEIMPQNYFPGNDPAKEPKNLWRSYAHLLFANWLDDIYQNTPFELADVGK